MTERTSAVVLRYPPPANSVSFACGPLHDQPKWMEPSRYWWELPFNSVRCSMRFDRDWMRHEKKGRNAGRACLGNSLPVTSRQTNLMK